MFSKQFSKGRHEAGLACKRSAASCYHGRQVEAEKELVPALTLGQEASKHRRIDLLAIISNIQFMESSIEMAISRSHLAMTFFLIG